MGSSFVKLFNFWNSLSLFRLFRLFRLFHLFDSLSPSGLSIDGETSQGKDVSDFERSALHFNEASNESTDE